MVNQLQYEDVVNYAEQMRRFFDLVPASQRRVFLFTQFARDTRRSMQKLFDSSDLRMMDELNFHGLMKRANTARA